MNDDRTKPCACAESACGSAPAAADAGGMSRRSVFRVAGASTVGLGAAASLAACAEEPDYAQQFAESEPVTVNAADVPVGGGIVSGDYVVVQPTEGDFRAFSSTCTHEGCQIRRFSETEMICPCHTSGFSVENGAVLYGPAQEPLPQGTVTDDGGTLTITPTA